MLIANLSSRARLWPISAKSARVAVRLPAGRAVWSVDFDGTGDRIVYVDNKGAVVVRELASGREVQLKGAPEQVSGAVFSADGRYVLGATDSDPIVWRVDQPSQPLSELKGHRGPVNEMAIGHDDKMLTAGSDDTVRMWTPSGEELVVMRGNEDELTTAIFTTDGTQVLSSGRTAASASSTRHSGSARGTAVQRAALRCRAAPRRHGRDAGHRGDHPRLRMRFLRQRRPRSQDRALTFTASAHARRERPVPLRRRLTRSGSS